MMPNSFDEVQDKVDQFTQNMKYGLTESKIMGGWSNEALNLQVQFRVLEENLLDLEENLLNFEREVIKCDNDLLKFVSVNKSLSNKDLNEIHEIRAFEEQCRTGEKIGKDKGIRQELTDIIIAHNDTITGYLKTIKNNRLQIEIVLSLISKFKTLHDLIEKYKKVQNLIAVCNELDLSIEVESFLSITSYCNRSLAIYNSYKSSCINFLNPKLNKKPGIIEKAFNYIKPYKAFFDNAILHCEQVIQSNEKAIHLLKVKEAEQLKKEQKQKDLLRKFGILLKSVEEIYKQIEEEKICIEDKYEKEYTELIGKEEPSSSDLKTLNWLFNAFNEILHTEEVSNIQLVSTSSDESDEISLVILPLCYNGKTKSLLGELMSDYDSNIIISEIAGYNLDDNHKQTKQPPINIVIHVHCATIDNKSGKSGGIGFYYKSFKIEGVEYIRPIIVDVAGERPGRKAKKGKNQYEWELSKITDYNPNEEIIETKYLNDDLNEEEESFRR